MLVFVIFGVSEQNSKKEKKKTKEEKKLLTIATLYATIQFVKCIDGVTLWVKPLQRADGRCESAGKPVGDLAPEQGF